MTSHRKNVAGPPEAHPKKTPAVSTVFRRVLGTVRRSLWISALAMVVLLIAWWRFWSPVRVDVARVDRGTIIQDAFGRGTIESQREAELGFDLMGKLSEVLVDEGAQVTLGQELARLDTNQAQADLRSAQTSVHAARSSLKRLAAEEERSRALLATAAREAARTAALFDTGAVAEQVRDEANDRLRVAQADLDRVLAQRAEATRHIDVASGGAEQRRVTMGRATLLAPFDGIVTRRLREPGDAVPLGASVLRLVDTGRVYINAAVDETMLPRLAVGQPSAIFFPGSNSPVPGRVTKISWEADRQTHEILVEVTPERLQRRVAIGQRADVRIEVDRKAHVLRVPIAMLHHDATGSFIYSDCDGKIALVRPRFGMTGGEHIEVLDKLTEGDLVLAASDAKVNLPLGRRWVKR